MISTSKTQFSREINAFSDMVLSEIDLGDADTWQVKVSVTFNNR